jgi:hypothetical protein
MSSRNRLSLDDASLLFHLDELVRTKPPGNALVGNPTDEHQEWVGRARALIAAWDGIRGITFNSDCDKALAPDYSNPVFPLQAFARVMSTIQEARSELRMRRRHLFESRHIAHWLGCTEGNIGHFRPFHPCELRCRTASGYPNLDGASRGNSLACRRRLGWGAGGNVVGPQKTTDACLTGCVGNCAGGRRGKAIPYKLATAFAAFCLQLSTGSRNIFAPVHDRQS